MKLFDINSQKSQFLLIDAQEKLVSMVENERKILKNIKTLLKACDVMEIPVKYTEHYPSGLGPTVKDLLDAMPQDSRSFEKIHFSCCEEKDFHTFLQFAGRDQIIIAGIETHICVLQTVIDLINKEHEVFVAADACSSRSVDNHNMALETMRQFGAVVLPTESIIYRLLRRAGTQAFKALLPYFK